MFSLTGQTIDDRALRSELLADAAGGLAVFEGLVRDHNEGKAVSALAYEIYDEMALSEAERIFAEARAKFDVIALRGVHRSGLLQIGEMAVWVGASARHRAEAFAACRYLIDEIKARLPIWKKEHYVEGEAEWVACHGCDSHGKTPVVAEDYYRRQISLEDFGPTGQEALGRARVLVIGAGGLGCPALAALAGAGVGRITVCDGDRLDVTNLHRQTLYDHADLGEPKAELATRRLWALNPLITVAARVERMTGNNVTNLVAEHDVVLDCTDNFATRFLVNDACFAQNKVLVQAAIYRYEGQLQVFDYRDEASAGCLRCVWPEEPRADCVGGCTEVGVLAPVPAVLGALQAMETIKVITGRETPATTATVLVDLQTLATQRIARPRNPDCPLCGTGETTELVPQPGHEAWEIGLEEFRTHFPDGRIVDIREAWERTSVGGQDPAWEHLPLSEPAALLALDPTRQTLLVCQHGVRTFQVVSQLRERGLERVWSLPGGVSGLVV